MLIKLQQKKAYQIATEEGIIKVKGRPVKIRGYSCFAFFLHREEVLVKAKKTTIFIISEKTTGRLISWGYSEKRAIEKGRENLSSCPEDQIKRQIKRKAIKMENKPLHIKYRPKTFEKIIGNKQTVKCLQSMLKKEGHPRVFMFHGKPGCGKTTLARIIAKEVGCSKHSLVEINTADDRGIETGRNILQMVKTSPLFGKSRVIILDECHQMSKDFQGSLLKVLEEPPENTYFIFCTTDPHKVIETIRGQRCTQFEIKPCASEEITGLLEEVIKKEAEYVNKEVVSHIAELSEGIPRKALVFLGKIIHLKDKSLQAVEKILLLEEENKQAIDLCRALISGKDWNTVKGILKSIVENKPDYEQVRQIILGYVSAVALNSGNANKRTMLIYECFKDPFYTAGKAHLIFACLFCLK